MAQRNRPSKFSNLLRFSRRMWTVARSGGTGSIVAKIRDRLGPAGRAYRRRKRQGDRQFDRAGYDTGGIQHVYRMSVVGPNAAAGGNHIAVAADEFADALAFLDIPLAGASFVDLGSGKGRAVLLAAGHPFARVIGVEFARELHQVALANVARRAEIHGADDRIGLHLEDASRFPLPPGPVVIFLFNSFDPPVLTDVVAAAMASWRADPRTIRVLYMNPVHRGAWPDGGWREVAARPGLALFAPPHDGTG